MGVAYDARHARTHLLGGAALRIIERCRVNAASAADLASVASEPAAPHGGTEADQALAQAAAAMARALEVAGLLLPRPR